ncbi:MULTISPECIES: hypothetical protein [unclassified Streptomyces]|nr:hypothetical protein [Streptomyces sp. TSRI0281]
MAHRDIKPSNIIVRPNGIATVVDFGISLAVSVGVRPVAGRERESAF